MSDKSSGADWTDGLRRFKLFKQRFGHGRVPAYWEDDPILAWWATKVRTRLDCLTKEQIRQLYGLGFYFGRLLTGWVHRYLDLVEYNATRRHCNVPESENMSLGRWVQHQRAIRGHLDVQRLKLLSRVGFDWSPLDTLWEQRVAELRAFKKRHGHCNVRSGHPKYPQLATWVTNVREKHDKLSPLRRRQLERLGFNWTPLASSWEKRIQELAAFRKAHGHRRVPFDSPLGRWLAKQRGAFVAGRLSQQRQRRLETLGVEFRPYQSRWERRFEELKAFKALRGHCDVPHYYHENTPLGRWVTKQRQHKNRRTFKQIVRLNQLGFRWHVRTPTSRRDRHSLT